MATPIAMPKLGITMEEGTVVEWPHAIGDHVEKGQVVLIIESEKAEVEIEASASGYVRHHYADAGDTVPCGTLLGAITPEKDVDFDAAAFAAEQAERAPKVDVARAAPTPGPRPAAALAPRTASAQRPDRIVATPAARVRARAAGVDLARVTGTGPGGRITRGDVEDWAERRSRLVMVADGVGLDVARQGEGEPVVLLPGLGTDVSVFARQIPVLARTHLVLGVNPRGVAGSDAPEEEAYPVEQAARDAVAVTDAPVHVVGASLGAAVALEMALAHPERVRSLTLVTPFVSSDARLDAVSESWRRLAAEVDPAELARALLPWFFSSDFLAEPAARERLVRGLAATLARVPATTLDRSVAGLRAWSGTREGGLGAVTVPTLVIVAGGDLLTPHAAAVAAAIPGATSVVVPGAGHAVTIESPEAVNDAVTAHLSATS